MKPLKKMKDIRIETNEDLMAFIEDDKTTLQQAKKVVEVVLNVWVLIEDKEELIVKCKEHIERFSNYAGERPIFLV